MTRLVRLTTADTAIGFAGRTFLIAAAVLIAIVAVAAFDPPRPLSLLAPILAGAILLVAYLLRPIEGLLVLALVVLFYDTLARPLGASIKQLDEVATGLIVVAAFVRALPRIREWLWWPRDVAIAIVFLAALASTVAAAVPIRVWLPELVLVGKPIAFLYAVMWTPIRRWEIDAAMRTVLGVGLVVVGLGILELVFPAAFQGVFELPIFPPRGPLPTVKAVFVHPALFGWFTAFVALFLFAMYVETRGRLWLALAFVFSLGPMLSARRKAILSIFAGVAAAFVRALGLPRLRANLGPTWAPIGIGMAILVIAFVPLLGSLYSRTMERYVPTSSSVPVPRNPLPGDENDDNDPSPQARVALYEGAVKIALDKVPLGGGLGRYASWMSRVEYSPLYEQYGLSMIPGLRPANSRYATDTFWPQILGEFGIIGLAGYAAFLGSLAWMLWTAVRRDDSAVMRAFRLGAGMVLAQAITESFANAMFHSPPRVYLLFLAIGAVASMQWRREADELAPH